jgi:hypothetical protein
MVAHGGLGFRRWHHPGVLVMTTPEDALHSKPQCALHEGRCLDGCEFGFRGPCLRREQERMGMPRFTTKIRTDGPHGNILMIAGAAGALMRQLGVPDKEITEFYRRVSASQSYDASCAIVEEYFPLERDE